MSSPHGHTLPVLIIGAGEAGIAMGCSLKTKMGFDQFRIVDRQSGIGGKSSDRGWAWVDNSTQGTWWINRYPGVACDIPTAAYSYSFAPNYTHTGIYSSGLDFCKYLDSVTKRFDLESKIQLNTDVTRLHYDEKADEWEVLLLHLAAGAGDLSSKDRQQRLDTHGADSVILGQETLRAKIVISCVGFLVEPKLWPKTIPGRETFRGEVIHSARWRQEVDFEHKDVVVIGTGCSASQIVPAILDEPFHVKSVTQVMRTPPWLGPSIAEPFGKETYARVAPVIFRYAPWLGFFFRVSLFMLVETIWVSAFQRGNVKSRARFEKDSLNRVRSAIPQKYHAMMTPEYPYGSKRRLFDIAWLGSMNKPNYHLTTKVLKSVGPFTVTLGSSRASPNQPIERTESEDDVEVHADVIVLANGYDASLWIQPLDVYGRGGKSIHEFWNERGGPQAYMGTAVDGFPNFFMVEGPNTITGHWSMILVTENMVGYIIKIIKPVLQGNARFVEPKKQATLEWADRIQRDLQRTVFVDSKSWYQDESGFNSMMYPRSQTDFTIRCMFPRYSHWNIAYSSQHPLTRYSTHILGGAVAVTVFGVSMLWALIKKRE